MKVISLQSGSNGNCFYVEAGDVALLVDAGISGRTAEQRLAQHGRDIRDVQGLFVTHDHSDHIRCLGVFQRKFGLPVYITRETLRAAMSGGKLGRIEQVNYFRAGESVVFTQPDSTVTVSSIPTPHDSADGVAYVIEDSSGKRVGILTDLGHVWDGLREVLRSLDAVVIESNYDPQMLEWGNYPWRLKRRIRGHGGHLSNLEAAQLIEQSRTDRLRWAALCHLSEDNNCPEVARRTHQKILGEEFPIHIASRYESSGVWEI